MDECVFFVGLNPKLCVLQWLSCRGAHSDKPCLIPRHGLCQQVDVRNIEQGSCGGDVFLVGVKLSEIHASIQWLQDDAVFERLIVWMMFKLLAHLECCPADDGFLHGSEGLLVIKRIVLPWVQVHFRHRHGHRRQVPQVQFDAPFLIGPHHDGTEIERELGLYDRLP